MFAKRLKIVLLYFVLPPAVVAAYVFEQGGSVAAEIFLLIWGLVIFWILVLAPAARPTRSDIHRVSDQLEQISNLLKKANDHH